MMEFVTISLDVAKKLSRASRHMNENNMEVKYEYYDAYDQLKEWGDVFDVDFLGLRAAALEMQDFSTAGEWNKALLKRHIDFLPNFAGFATTTE